MSSCVIYYEHIARDYKSYSEIAQAVRDATGGSCEVQLFSCYFQWSESLDYLRRHKVDLIIMPWMRWSPHYDRVYPFYRKNPDVKFLILNSEQVGSPVSMRLLTPIVPFAKRGCYHCAWTQTFADALEACGVPRENVFITGNAKLAEVEGTDVTRRELARRFGLDLNKRWLLYAESRNVTVLEKEYFIERQRFCGVSEDEIGGQRRYFRDSYDATFEQILHIPNEFFNNYELIYRLHPGMPQDTHSLGRVRAINELSIGDWLPSVDALITPGSTSAFEADIAGVPVLIHTPIPYDERYVVGGVGLYKHVRDLASIDDKVIDEAASLQQSDSIYRRYVGEVDGGVNQRIGQLAVSIMDDYEPLPVKVPKPNMKLCMRLYVCDKVSHLFYRLGWLQRLKWPHSGYENIKDIPPEWKGNGR